jgi:hypothetical protein
MMKEIKKIDPMSMAKISALLYFVTGIVLAIAGIIAGPYIASQAPLYAQYGWLVVILVPLIYLVAGFVVGYVVAVLYNIFASKIGGIKIDLK